MSAVLKKAVKLNHSLTHYHEDPRHDRVFIIENKEMMYWKHGNWTNWNNKVNKIRSNGYSLIEIVRIN